MKNLFTLFLVTVLTAGIINCAEAQRTRELNRQGGPRTSGNNSTASRSTQRAAPVRTFSNPVRTVNNNNRSNSTARPQRNGITRTPQRSPSVTRSSQRTIVSRNGNTSRRGNSGNSYNNYRYSNYRYTNYRYHNRYYGNVYGRRTCFMYGQRYRVIPHSFISIHFGGHPYYYNSGYFYGYYAGYYQPLFPPYGLRISVLPIGYSRFFIGASPYYYYHGIYYRQYNHQSYEVVDAPMGATVSSLPEGARSVIINGEKLYELNGTYYKADRDSNGGDVFIVVGKNGVVNNSSGTGNIEMPPSLQIGDILAQLPEGSKIVTIHGEEVYETPDNIYLSEESNNGVVQYKVIGK